MTLLDDHKQLRLSNGECLDLHPGDTVFLLPVLDADPMTYPPALISRLGRFYLHKPPSTSTEALGASYDRHCEDMRARREHRAPPLSTEEILGQIEEDDSKLETLLERIRTNGDQWKAWLYTLTFTHPSPELPEPTESKLPCISGPSEPEWEFLQPASGSLLTVKAECEGQIRRWTLPGPPGSLEAFTSLVEERFGLKKEYHMTPKGKVWSPAWALAYRDTDGDLINLVNQADYQEMIKHEMSLNGGPLKLYIMMEE